MLVTLASLCFSLPLSLTPQADWSPWSGLGPFPYSWEKGVANPLPFETLDAFRLDGTGPDDERYEGFEKSECSWRKAAGAAGTSNELDVGRIDIKDAWPDAVVNDSRIFLHRSLTAHAAAELPVIMGSDDGIRVWWNGERVVNKQVQRVLRLGDTSVVLDIAVGVNHLLIELSQKGGGYGFQMGEPREAGKVEIDNAIETGVQWLLKEQWIDGNWGAHAGFRGGHAAFTAYTLMKMGVSKDHPAVRKALRYSRRNPGDFTYTASSEILAECELGDSADKAWLKKRVKELAGWQESSGQFGYPLHPDGNARHAPDLSCTLFAALAFHAATKRGIKVPTKTWQEMVNGTLRNIGRSYELELPNGKKGVAAGFYYWPGKAVTGSMTAAGLAILNLAERAAEKKIPRKNRNEMEKARERGLAWLDDHLDYTQNPGEGAGHHYFFLYNIERTAALLGLQEIGGRDWYQEGANYLISVQDPKGHWGSAPQVDTLLALLFLKRATLPRSGQRSALPPRVYATKEGDIRLRAQGDTKVAMYIEGFSAEAIEQYAWEDEAEQGLRVLAVEYHLSEPGATEPIVLQTVSGDGTVPSGAQRFPHAHTFKGNGRWELSAHVRVVPPGGEGEVVLSSESLSLEVDAVLDHRSLSYVDHPGENRFRKSAPTLSVSTSEQGEASALLDGAYTTAWLADPNDDQPSVRIELRRSQRGGRLLLTHARPRLRHATDRRPSEIALRLNDEETITVKMDPHVVVKTEIDLGKKRFKTLEITITETVGPAGGSVGFSEIELVGSR